MGKHLRPLTGLKAVQVHGEPDLIGQRVAVEAQLTQLPAESQSLGLPMAGSDEAG
jgi:hypothetical protein